MASDAASRSVSIALSRAHAGLQAPPVRVEAHIGRGLPTFALVGLAETAVRESRERVRSALVTSGFDFPVGRITVNLSPADLPKEGGRFDLPIALAILGASMQIPGGALKGREFYGELALSGELRETPKLLPALIEGSRAHRDIILPAANAIEASCLAGSRLMLAGHLREVCQALRGRLTLSPARLQAPPAPGTAVPDLADVRGQFMAKRALEIAAAGAHGLLLIGPPGSGKTLLAQRLPGLLPPLDDEEALQVASLESLAGTRPRLDRRRPFRNPQHTASVAALVGGGSLKPGELSLAHCGVLFLDELPEFARNALEALREPLESGMVVIRRAKRTFEFPAKFQLVAAMNPCPCGFAGAAGGRCRCPPGEVSRYLRRVSGPLIDRIDLHAELTPLPVEHLLAEPATPVDDSATVAVRVHAARRRQLDRQQKLNAHLTPAETPANCTLDRECRALLSAAVTHLGLSARACHRVLKVARTCADLAAEPAIRRENVLEAVGWRTLDRERAS